MVEVPSANERHGTTESAKEEDGAEGADPVILSPAASQISQAAATARAARASRVASLKQQVQSGNYRVDKDALANRLADDALARRGRR